MRFFLRIITISFILLALALTIFFFVIRVKEHELPQDLFEQYSLESSGDSSFRYGPNILQKNENGIWEIYIEGDAAERGVAYGMLAEKLIHKQEAYFVEQLERLVPSDTYRWWLKWFVAWFNRDLDEHIPLEYQQEIFAVSQFASDDFDHIAPKYYRKLSYHAAHDLGHAMKDLKMVGCTSFAVNGEFSTDSALLIGRNFDFYMGENFSKEKVFLIMNPDSGYRFASYSWPGFVGVVSGMNEKGLTVTINAARSDVPTKAKTPISLLAREILQYAANIDEAVVMAKKREVFVSESILIGSAADNRAVILEKSPEKFGVYSNGENFLVCSNHYQSEAYSNDSNNIQNIRGSDSKYRYELMAELLQKKYPVSVEEAVKILREQKGMGGKDLGMGNPKLLNQLMAHHAVVFKPEKMQMWVSSNPYQLGEFVGYDFKRFFSSDDIDTVPLFEKTAAIPADSFINSEDFKNYKYFLKMREKLFDAYFLNKDFELSPATEDSFIHSNPNSYLTYLSLGEYFKSKENCTKAIQYFEMTLENEPSSADEIVSIRKKISDCKN